MSLLLIYRSEMSSEVCICWQRSWSTPGR